MQLKKSKSVRKMLAVATTSLLSGVAYSANSSGDKSWEMESAILFYSEADRVSVIEPVVSLRKDMGDDNFLNLRFVLDSLTGSSPNGASKTAGVQTFTTPSGNATYTTAANQTPLDSTFHDTRGAVNAEWEMPLNKTTKAIFGANISKEFDYQSLGVSANFSWDFNNRNTTLTAGAALNADTINPVGGVPTGLTVMPTTTAVTKATTGSDDTKQVTDFIIGVTQVINRSTLMQFNLNIGSDSGYMTDPYKILTVLGGAPNTYLYEKRPDSRARQALYWKTVMGFDEDVLNLSYRYYWDDWDVSSHTIEAKYRFSLGEKHYLQPEVRYYVQDKANFYYYNLDAGAIPTTYASADYRLADLKTTTLAFKYGIDLDKDSEFSVRLGKMNQTSNGDAPFEDVDATFVQLNYRMVF